MNLLPTPEEFYQITQAFDLSDHPEVPGKVIPSRLINGQFIDMWNLDGAFCEPEVVAHALSLINRYAGQTPFPYSVGQHSLLVSGLVRFDLAYEGLWHDICEGCGLGDIVSPLKRKNPIIKVVEQRMRTALVPYFDLRDFEPALVKEADQRAYKLERWIMHGYPCPSETQETLDYAREMIREYDWRKVQSLMLDMHFGLRPVLAAC